MANAPENTNSSKTTLPISPFLVQPESVEEIRALAAVATMIFSAKLQVVFLLYLHVSPAKLSWPAVPNKHTTPPSSHF